MISIHALLAESDRTNLDKFHKDLNFYPRSPCGERLFNACCTKPIHTFLSTLSLRRATGVMALPITPTYISIHALLAESDNSSVNTADQEARFLSTLSLRRATTQGVFNLFANPDFYPRSPCGERQLYINRTAEAIIFLSTLSLRRATVNGGAPSSSSGNFYPRSPCGERQPAPRRHDQYNMISIHALLAESDTDAINGCNSDIISIHALLAESDQCRL